MRPYLKGGKSKITPPTILRRVLNTILSRLFDKIRRAKIIIAINVCGLTIVVVICSIKGRNHTVKSKLLDFLIAKR